MHAYLYSHNSCTLYVGGGGDPCIWRLEDFEGREGGRAGLDLGCLYLSVECNPISEVTCTCNIHLVLYQLNCDLKELRTIFENTAK